jgi:hypothetical protein
MTNFNFITADGNTLSGSFNIVPINYPTISSSFILTGEVITSSLSPVSLSLADNTYKVEYNNKNTSNNWYVKTISGSIYSVSGSSITSASVVTFNLANHISNPLAVRTVDIVPINKNTLFNGSFVSQEKVTYTTDNNGSLTVSLIQQPYTVNLNGKNKYISFNILPSGSSCNAKDVIVSNTSTIPVITPINISQFGYTAQVSDLRYALSGSIGTSSYAITASYVLNSNNYINIDGGNPYSIYGGIQQFINGGNP